MLNVLLVCTGNICRSPMAEAFLKARLNAMGIDARVRSAGTAAFDGHGATPHAVTVMARAGLDISGHRSAAVARRLVREADLVLTMTSAQRREVLDVAPQVAPRTFTLKESVALLEALPAVEGSDARTRIAAAHEFRRGGVVVPDDQDVADPYGSEEHFYSATAEEIRDLVDRLGDGLSPAPAAVDGKRG